MEVKRFLSDLKRSKVEASCVVKLKKSLIIVILQPFEMKFINWTG